MPNRVELRGAAAKLGLLHWGGGIKIPKGMAQYRIGSLKLNPVTFPKSSVLRGLARSHLQARRFRVERHNTNCLILFIPTGTTREARQQFLDAVEREL